MRSNVSSAGDGRGHARGHHRIVFVDYVVRRTGAGAGAAGFVLPVTVGSEC